VLAKPVSRILDIPPDQICKPLTADGLLLHGEISQQRDPSLLFLVRKGVFMLFFSK